MSTATLIRLELIACDPSIRKGRPVLAGTTLRVTDVVIAYIYHQRTIDQIASDYDLSLAQVHAALAYYYQHQAELTEDIRTQIQQAAEYKERRVGSRYPSLLPR